MEFNYCSIGFVILLFYVTVTESVQSSITFVIDDTPSMRNDIASVRLGAIDILRTVLRNKDVSQIDNFILITFNDDPITTNCPSRTKLHEKTKDETRLINALNAINVDRGSPGCSGCCIAGIKRGVDESLPGSTLYVFTDATAKDYYLYDQVKQIAQKKRCKIVFVLTGMCGASPNSAEYAVYENIAQNTGGNVFHIDKQDLSGVLEYVKSTVTGNMETKVSKMTPGNNNITINADPLMGEILFSISARDSNPALVSVKGPDGFEVYKKVIFENSKSKAFAFNPTKIGPYTIQVYSTMEAEAVVSVKSEVDYDYGFSDIKLNSLVDASELPVPGAKTYLLLNLNKGDIMIKSVQLLDTDDVLETLPLEQLTSSSSFYTTKDFEPPTKPFKISIVGTHQETGTDIIRTSPTAIEPIKILPELKQKEQVYLKVKLPK